MITLGSLEKYSHCILLKHNISVSFNQLSSAVESKDQRKQNHSMIKSNSLKMLVWQINFHKKARQFVLDTV